MSVSKAIINATVNPKGRRIHLDGDAIAAQILPDLRGEISTRFRAPDVRVILKTAATGASYEFGNHGHPDNEQSTVQFDGASSIMIMPAKETPRAQVTSANQIIAAVKDAGLEGGVTPEFIEQMIVNPKGQLRKFAAQIYGPAPFEAQAGRLKDVVIPGVNGGTDTITPEVGSGYAVGMRPRSEENREEAFLVICEGSTEQMFIKAGNAAATAMTRIGQATNVKMKGANTAEERFDSLDAVSVYAVLAFDAATKKSKPIKLPTARQIFEVATLNQLTVDTEGTVTGQFLNMTMTPGIRLVMP